jgi:predicted ATPase/DNA-binding CsgD family transcriptional regulator
MADTVLPLPATRLFGREDELRLVAELLEDSRLVTLTGAGGCGKTRLALTVANQHADRYDDVYWVDLASLTDPALVPKAVGSALRLADRPGAEPVDWLINAIDDRALLLVIDNCEHLVDACAELVSRLLRGCSRTTVLATSREPLGVEGETSYRVPSLAVPPADAPVVHDFPAVALFADRAAKAKPGFAVTDDNAAAVVEICRRLDGIPLALELAAPRVRMMTPGQIAAALGDRFQLLTGGVRTALPRQRTLEASVAWSYDLLSDDERWVLRQLAVFAGGFSLETALGVCETGPPQLLDILGRLVERSLLQVDDSGDVARYRLLETVRAYVLGQLVDAGEVTAARDRHLGAYVDVAERAAAAFIGPQMVATFDALDAELDNLRAAMDWAAASDQVEKALRIAGSLTMYWFIRTRHDEALTRMRVLLAAAPDADPLLRYITIMSTLLLSLATDIRGTLELAREARAIADAHGDDRMRSQAYAWLNQAELMLGLTTESDLMRESLRFARASGDSASIGRSLQWLGTQQALGPNPRGGIELLDEAVALFRSTANHLQLAWALTWRGVAARFTGDLTGAVAFQTEAEQLMSARQEETFHAQTLSELAGLYVLMGDYDGARVCSERAVASSRLSVAPYAEGYALMGPALLAFLAGDYAQTSRCSARAVAAFESSGSRRLSPLPLTWLSRAELRLGNYDTALEHLRAARELAIGPITNGYVSLCLAEVAAEGGPGDAVALVSEALQLGLESNDLVNVVDALELLARVLSDDDGAAAARLLGAAQSGRDLLGYVRFPIDAESHEHLVRRLLGESGGEEAWAAGTALTLTEAIAYATRGRGPRRRPSTGWDSLSPMERDVAALVAKGMSNPDIAAQLFISRNTVKAHLAHVYNKLGIANRSELAAEVSRRELTQGATQA